LKLIKDIFCCGVEFFYLNDLHVLIDIIRREISSLSKESMLRSKYLEVLLEILKSRSKSQSPLNYKTGLITSAVNASLESSDVDDHTFRLCVDILNLDKDTR